MNILLIHPEDDPEQGPWSKLAWDRIVDLGLGGANSYERWSAKFRCPVTTLSGLRNGFDVFQQVRGLQDLGAGKLVDDYGLDWWEIMSMLLHGEMEAVILLQRFLGSLGSADQVFVSRPGLHASLLQGLRPKGIEVFPARKGKKRSPGHYLRLARKLTRSQMIDVIWDKYDLGYQLRARFARGFARKSRPSIHPVVLVPSAYVNVSRTGAAYANTFPEQHFLLVATRRSGWMPELPPNMTATRLSSYASLRDRSAEYAEIESRWKMLRMEISEPLEFAVLNRKGYFDKFPVWLRHGFEVRDAWRNVLDTEPVQAVLCADDSNPYTRIPLLLAQERGTLNIACHHGALDGRYVFKRIYGSSVWVKGKMEEDYLVRKCGVPQERVEIAAPSMPANSPRFKISNRSESQSHILFLSEVFEAGGGRAEEFYRDVVPPLAELAIKTGRKLIVKLHPGESVNERTQMLSRLLSAEQNGIVRIVSAGLTEELLRSSWFAITILSTVATECAIRGIPCFLCKWLESWPYDYVDQFIRYGVGIGLNCPSEIEKIPEYLLALGTVPDAIENCWQPAAPQRLRSLILAQSQDRCVDFAASRGGGRQER